MEEVHAQADTKKMEKMKEANDFSNHYDYTYRLQDGNCIRINPETQERAKVHHSYCNNLKKEMEMNVAEEEALGVGHKFGNGQEIKYAVGTKFDTSELPGSTMVKPGVWVITKYQPNGNIEVKCESGEAEGKTGLWNMGSLQNFLKSGMKVVSENSQINEMTDAVSWEAIAAGMAAIGLAPLAIDKMHKWWEKKHPKSFKAAQKLSGTIDKQMAGNTPGQGHGVDTSKSFGPQNEKQLSEFTGTETESSGAIAMIAAALGMGIPLATALIKDLMKAKSPEEKKQVIQSLSLIHI